jgi:hypothetical protein
VVVGLCCVDTLKRLDGQTWGLGRDDPLPFADRFDRTAFDREQYPERARRAFYLRLTLPGEAPHGWWPAEGYGALTLVRFDGGTFTRLLIYAPAGWPPLGASETVLHVVWDHVLAHGLALDHDNVKRLQARAAAYEQGNETTQ